MLFGDSAAVSPTRARKTGSKSPLDNPSRYRRASQARLRARAALVAIHNLGVEPVRANLGRHIAYPRETDLNGAHADANGALGLVAISIAPQGPATRALIAAPTQKIIDFRLQRRLEHLAGSLAHHHLEHIIRRGDGCCGRQNLIAFTHAVTSLLYARRQPGSLIVQQGGYVAPLTSLRLEPATIFHSSSLVGWGGYWRWLRAPLVVERIWIRRGRCSTCRRSHALLPDLVLARRLDVVDVIGRGVATKLTSKLGLRPIAEQLDVPHTTLRAWWQRFRVRSSQMLAHCTALAVALAGTAVDVSVGVARERAALLVQASGRLPSPIEAYLRGLVTTCSVI